MSEIAQQIVVAMVALGAAGFVVRRIVLAIRPPAGAGPCPSCDSGSTACGDAAARKPSPSAPEVKPLVFVRSKSH